MIKKVILIVGAGSWGTALAVLANRVKHQVFLMVRNQEVADKLNSEHTIHYLANVTLDANIHAVYEYPDNIDLIIFAVPAEYLPDAFDKAVKRYGSDIDMIIATKGMMPEGILFSDYFVSKYKISPIFLSGPTFAAEVAGGLPSACNIAAAMISKANEIASYLEDENFKIQTTTDIISVQIAGCYKNIMAIYLGYISQMSAGENYKAKIFTESIAELVRICEKFGGRRETIYSYAGIGDMILTSYSILSRNFRFGAMLAQHKKNNISIKDSNIGTIEGIFATKSLSKFCISFLNELEILPLVTSLIKNYESGNYE